ncbi:hypothetical protein B0O80DRAFT_11415 [Mortierella sp. GBAus27b]|nr:hypothetical protein B0O80DRAFT_11415 [Mortierella sp. GBAus27b]
MKEGCYVQAWGNIFSTLLSGSDIKTMSGEGMSEATKALKKDEGGRKVDLLFFRRNIELGNIEFKCANPRPSEIRRQHSKNIRINRAIMESHFNAYDQRYEMMFMDIQGWVGNVFALYPYKNDEEDGKVKKDDVSVCKHLHSLVLPRSQMSLREFLADECEDLDSLLRFAVWKCNQSFRSMDSHHAALKHCQDSMDLRP